MIVRSNEEWQNSLRAEGAIKEAALFELNQILVAGLPRALSRWLQSDDPRLQTLVEDVAQDAVLRAVDKIDTFEGRSKFTTWVYKIAIRMALTEIRKAKWREVSLEQVMEDKTKDSFSKHMGDDFEIELSMEQKEIMDLVMKTIQKDLSEKQRLALTAVALKGIPLEEVARRMDTSRNTLYKLLHDSRLKLKRVLEKQGLSWDEIISTFNR